MPEPVVEIPNRPLFRASEVCEIAQIPAYVLKSWEKEFPGLGTSPKAGAPRVYRRTDVEQVMRIKQMLFAEGLTLSGARRKLEGEPKVEEEPLPDLELPGNVRSRVAQVKQELRSLLDLLSAPPAQAERSGGQDEAPLVGRDVDTNASPSPESAAADRVAESTWPPASNGGSDHAPADDGLPLLDGKPEDPNPPKPRRSVRRPPRVASESH